MTQRIEPVPLTGGPSAGKTYRAVTRWPTYLNGQGDSIKTPDGDRIMRGARTRIPGCYLKQTHHGKVTGYVWVARVTRAIVDV